MKAIPSHRPESERAAAARLTESMGFPVSRDMIRSWQKRSFDLGDLEKLRHQLRQSERPPRGLLAVEAQPPAKPSAVSGEAMTPQELDQRLVELQAALLAAKDYEKARMIRVQISGIRELFRVQCDRGLYVTCSSAAADGAQAATASKAAWEGIEDELPPRLEGLSAAQMKKELRTYGQLKSRELAEVFGAMI